MADLDVQPKKKKTSGLMWLIIVIIVLALIAFLLRSCNKNDTASKPADTTAAVVGTTMPATDSTAGANSRNTAAGADTWGNIDQNAPEASYGEITNKNISVRGNDNYGIYSLGEDILFDHDKSTIRKDAEQNLKQLAASINKRFKGGDIRIYGFTDSTGTPGYNKELAEQRASAVRSWLAANAGMDSAHITLNPIGEGRPVASNSTAKGRQANRRVEVIARKAQ